MLRTFILFFSLLLATSVAASYSNTTFEEAFNKHSSIMLLIDPVTGEIVDANAAATQFYGYPINTLRRMTIQQINMLSSEQVAKERVAAKNDNRNYFIFRHKTSNGTIKTVQVHSSAVTIKSRQLLFSTIRDISLERSIKEQLWQYQSNLEAMVDEQVNTLQKQSFYLFIGIIFLISLSIFLVYLLQRKNSAEAQIKTLAQIVQQSPVSIATLGEQGEITYGNAEFVKQLNLKHGLDSLKANNLITLYDKCNPNISALIESMKKNSQWQGELLTIDKNDQEYWEFSNVYPLSAATDNAKHVIINQDITHIKENEKQLRLASAVFHTATEAVMICDANNHILAINTPFTEITGYLEQEALGHNPSILNSGHHDDSFYRQMFKELENTGWWQGEICNRRKNGEVYYEWLSITALTTPDGQLEAYVSLFTDITSRKKVEDKIYYQANFDALTGLANKNLFSDRLKHCLNLAECGINEVALLFIDLDGFKQINDSLGHAQGDLLLKKVSERLTKILRKSDMLARLNGDEFAIILSDKHDIYDIEIMANKVIDEIAKPFQLSTKKGYITASIGIATSPTDASTVEELLKKADSAMYKVKKDGRNNFRFFTQAMDDEIQRKSQLTAELREAVHDQDFSVWFQPIHHSHTNHLSYTEALVRWNHPEKGAISPLDFIPLAEELGLINQLGYFVLNNACQQAVGWQSLTDNPPGVAVNVSSIQFEQDDFVDQVSEVLALSKLPPHMLSLGITESLLIADDIKVLNQLTMLKNLGVNISIDDFGTGYSSLSYLRQFPIDKLKIDKSFIDDVKEINSDTRLISAIISIATSLKMDVVAEGVETDFQLNQIKNLGCDFVQGYIFSKPLPAEELERYIIALNK